MPGPGFDLLGPEPLANVASEARAVTTASSSWRKSNQTPSVRWRQRGERMAPARADQFRADASRVLA